MRQKINKIAKLRCQTPHDLFLLQFDSGFFDAVGKKLFAVTLCRYAFKIEKISL